MKRKLLILCCVLILLMASALIVSADDDGTDNSTSPSNQSENNVHVTTVIFGILLIGIMILSVTIVVLPGLIFPSKNEKPSSTQNLSSGLRTLKISVMDEQKRPVEKATVGLKGMQGGPTNQIGQTDANGRIAFNNIRSSIKEIEVTKIVGIEQLKTTHTIVSKQERIEIILAKPKTILLKIVDETNEPLYNIRVTIKDKQGFPTKSISDHDGKVKFGGLKSGEYQISIEHQEYVTFKGSYTASDETKRSIIKLTRQSGLLDVMLDIQHSDIKVVAKNLHSKSKIPGKSDSSGMVHFGKIPIGNYQISLQPNDLLKSDSHQCTIELNKKHTIKLMMDFYYKLSSENLSKMRQFNEIIDTSYQEVSSYDTCIQQYLKRIGEMPVELCNSISNNQLYFINSDLTPADFVQHTIDTAELLATGIVAIIRAKTNIDLYAEAKGLPQVEHIVLSGYPDPKLRELIQESAKYYTIHHVEVKNQLSSIDQEITQKSSDLTVHPIADMWSLCKDLLMKCDAENDPKKQGVMLFLLEQILINLEETFHNADVVKRLKLRTF